MTNKMQYVDITEIYNKSLVILPDKDNLDQYLLKLPQFADYQGFIIHDVKDLQELLEVVKENCCEKSVLQVIK